MTKKIQNKKTKKSNIHHHPVHLRSMTYSFYVLAAIFFIIGVMSICFPIYWKLTMDIPFGKEGASPSEELTNALLSGFCGVISLILCFACKFIAKWHTKKYLHIHRQNGNPHSSAVSSIETRRK